MHHYKGFGFKVDFLGIYNKFEIGLSIESIGPFVIKQNKLYSTGLNLTGLNMIQTELNQKVISNLSNRIIYGLKYNISENNGLIIENDINDWKDIDDSFLIFKSQNYDLNRISIGFFHHFKKISPGFFQSFSIRYGLFRKSWNNVQPGKCRIHTI